MLNATETAKVRVAGGPWKQAAQLDWFSVSWLEKVDGAWRRKSGSNRIAEGSIENLEDANTPDRHEFLTEFRTALCSDISARGRPAPRSRAGA